MEAKRAAVVVAGSSNMDLVVRTSRMPSEGETVLGSDFITVPGGKGANQAVAAARLGAQTCFIGKLGRDAFGEQLLAGLNADGVDTAHVSFTDEAASGVALIIVDDRGENTIVVTPGANALLDARDVDAARDVIASASVVAAQLEVPMETVEYLAACAVESGVPFILDPAPAREVGDRLLEMVDILTPNETEARMLTGLDVRDAPAARAAALRLLDRGAGAVIITMGSGGFVLGTSEGVEFIDAIKVEAVDSTAAGDVFAGALAAGLARGGSLREAADLANAAAALAVTKLGAQSSMPTLRAVKEFKDG